MADLTLDPATPSPPAPPPPAAQAPAPPPEASTGAPSDPPAPPSDSLATSQGSKSELHLPPGLSGSMGGGLTGVRASLEAGDGSGNADPNARTPVELSQDVVETSDQARNAAPAVDPAAFQAAYQQLTPEQRAQYDAVKAQVVAGAAGGGAERSGGSHGEGDSAGASGSAAADPGGPSAPQGTGSGPSTTSPAEAQLQAMLVDGRLLRTDSQGGTLLGNLAKVADPGTNLIVGERGQLVSDIVHDTYDPVSIKQAGHDTCTATSLQMALAQEQPAEYARLAAGLATPPGTVTLQNGGQLSSAGFINYADRSLTGNLFQPAIMGELARLNGQQYDQTQEGFLVPGENPWIGAPQAHHGLGDVAGEVTGIGYHTRTVGQDGSDADLTSALAGASPDRPFFVALDTTAGGHEVQVVGYDPDAGQVKIRNPWGQEEQVPVDQFRKALYAYDAPDAPGQRAGSPS